MRIPLHRDNHRGSRSLANTLYVSLTLLASMALSGCVTATVQQVRQASSSLSSTESVVILSRKHKTRGETEDNFIECVNKNVQKGDDGINVMLEQDFVDATFPWFEPRTAPLNVRELSKVIARPLIAERIEEIGVRYLVWIAGTTVRSGETGSVNCTMVSGGIPACFGFLTWENDSDYEASIWDVREGITIGKVSSEAAGTSFVPAVVVPIPFIARVQHGACTSLASQLKSFLGAGA
ncbi:MAG: hypothetical protein O7H39_18315 [Gammaproteobacteria bacterium]|nr:hypothetical protein [Gammaproteobacteria bacterium]